MLLPVYFSSNTESICEGDSLLVFGTYRFDEGLYTDSLQTANGCDSVFHFQLNVNPGYEEVFDLEICNGDSILIHGDYVLTSGTYVGEFQTTEGCDSTITVQLTVKTSDLTLTQNGSFLTANQDNATYQWVNCITGDLISGETQQSFDVVVSGVYAAIVTFEDCTDTTECIEVNTNDLNEINAFEFSVYPNPSTGAFKIVPNQVIENGELRVLDMNGKVLMTKTIKNGKLIEMNLPFDNGVYRLELTTDYSVWRSSIVLQR